jgi:catechol 2,3-dioxygenase-like lactoylglutathione lyase family enzyme
MVSPRTLDHVALWVSERDAIAEACIRELGMHEIERTDAFTLVGADARRGKLTLFDADAPRERGVIEHVAFRVPGGSGELELPDGLVLVAVDADEADLDHVALRSRDPESVAAEYERLGFRPAGPGRLEIGGALLELSEGDPGTSERPLLNHLGLLVDSAEEHRAEAEDAGIEIADFVDAPNTVAVFVWGPDHGSGQRVKIEYVEHKPTFALR